MARARVPLSMILPLRECSAEGACYAGSSPPRHVTGEMHCDVQVDCDEPRTIHVKASHRLCEVPTVCNDNCSPDAVPCTIPPLDPGTYVFDIQGIVDGGAPPPLIVRDDPSLPTSCAPPGFR